MNTNGNDKIRVLVISQQPLFLRGIQTLLSHIRDLEISATVDVNEDLLLSMEDSPPDVAVIDIDYCNDSGLTLAQQLRRRSPNIALIVLTSNQNDAQLFQALKAQAAAYLSKEIGADELTAIIRHVAKGEYPINEEFSTRPGVIEQVLNEFQALSKRSEAAPFIAPLTPREKKILACMAQGYRNSKIALQLGTQERTVKNQVSSVLRKLNSNNRTEAVVKAIKLGLVSTA